ncbi:aminoglycoside phosphotransferase family protein [Paenibacillus cisolokensis]|uniref:phosphotransferase family protein n=1 Tax=Paenibacillus cisolokensis TaxID=1658519 RepID=UPI003D290306
MNVLQTVDDVRRFLKEHRWVDRAETCEIYELSGGVSGRVWKIVTETGRLVLKQALPKLKVKDAWFSDVKRIEREQLAMSAVGQILESKQVPKIFQRDQENHAYLMTCAPEGSVPWKAQLLEGKLDRETAAAVGTLLRQMHEKSRTISTSIVDELKDLTYLNELRIVPFHHSIAAKYPELGDAIERLEHELITEKKCFVHGDFSPKNILVAKDSQLILLDFEAGHWGNPVFDLAFCTGHLLLKAFVSDQKDDMLHLIKAFLDAYGEWPNSFMRHLGLMLLARIDGQSRVEYVKEPDLKHQIRRIGKQWVSDQSEIHPFETMANALR